MSAHFVFRKTGSCSRENCPFKHEAAPAAKAEAKAKAKAEAKAKSEPSAAAKKTAKSKAKPAAPAVRMCRAWNPSAPAIWKRSSYIADDESECSSIDSDVDSDCSTDDEAFGTASPTKSPKRRRVSFAKDVKFQSTKPRRSYKERDHEVVKVDVIAMVNDASRATELEFAKRKARLKAQIMKDMVNDEEEGDRVTYVRLPATSQVAEVALYDGEDQIMERNLNAVDSKRVIDKGVFRCMVQPVILRKKIKFLMDTGCGHDLISQKKIERRDPETLVTPEPISFQTANGITDTDLVSNFQAESFKEPINAYVLGDTPSVLSVGKRCMNQNYGFVWPPGREPFMIDPDWKRISLFVNGDIPYVRVGSSKSLAHDDVEATAVLEVLNSAHVKGEIAAAAQAVPGEIDGEEEDGEEHGRPPDPDPHEVPGEEIPSEEAGRPPDPPGGGVGNIPLHEDDSMNERSKSKAREHHQGGPRLVLSKPKRILWHTWARIVIEIRIVNHAPRRR